jgi:hypothetical protein
MINFHEIFGKFETNCLYFKVVEATQEVLENIGLL